MAIVGVANLAVKVDDLDPAIEFYRRAGATIRDRQLWRNGERVDVRLGALDITFFTHAIYEPEVVVDGGFLHVALFTDDLDAEVEGHTVVWGPEVVSGVFGTRRIVFVEAPGGMRLEFMEQLAPPVSEAGDQSDADRLAGELLALGSATVGESGGRVLDRRLRPAWDGATVAGPCFPVRCSPGDNLALHAAVREAPAGMVLAVEVADRRDRGYWGEVLTAAAQARGVRGLVIDACVRDTEGLARLSFGTFATGRALPGASKTGPGALRDPVTVGGQRIELGDWIVADRDGVVTIAATNLDEVLEASRRRSIAEAGLIEQLRSGASTVDLLGLDTHPISGGA